jgi:hypothetical protein
MLPSPASRQMAWKPALPVRRLHNQDRTLNSTTSATTYNTSATRPI